MQQRCHLSMVWFTWLALPALAVIAGAYKGWAAGAFILVVGVLAQIAYIRLFPSLSKWLGYGSVADSPAGTGASDPLDSAAGAGAPPNSPAAAGATLNGAACASPDAAAGARGRPAKPSRVTLYTASVCPFCPIVRKRLREIRSEMGFELEEVDVTFRPGLVREKGLKSVPVVEANGRLLVGNATSAELAAFLRRAAGTAASATV